MLDGSIADGSMLDGASPDSGHVCVPAMCQSMIRACGDCIDNDGDGLMDDRDPDCLGPCDNNEAGFSLLIPGGEGPSCGLDCYFDQDQGPGNDGCRWDNAVADVNSASAEPPQTYPRIVSPVRWMRVWEVAAWVRR